MKNRAYCVTAHAWHDENQKIKITIVARNREKAIVNFFKTVSGNLWNIVSVEETLHEEH